MESNLFSDIESQQVFEKAPLAWRMRPEKLEEFLGQEKILGEGAILRKAIKEDKLSSLIFWGPPGSGKTTLAKIIAKISKAQFSELSAVTSSVSDVRKAISQAKEYLMLEEKKTILLIDELHRFNKAQQDALLPAVEEGLIILIGVTTENPYFEVNSPLISRSRIFVFEPLSPKDIETIMKRAITDKQKGLGKHNLRVSTEALGHIVEMSDGDARQALNSLEMATMTAVPQEDGTREITLKIAEDAVQKKAVVYDRDGDSHYDIISTFIKSIRGSDPDAALYWLARMIYAGEDPKFIARRMIIAASEDIGLADSKALEIAIAAARAVEFVGLPEARINLAHAVIYLSTAPKSNTVISAIDQALHDVQNKPCGKVPKHLRDAHYPGAKGLGHGVGYKYPHAYDEGYIAQDYMPSELKSAKYYNPSCFGDEKRITYYLQKLNKLKEEERRKNKST